MLRREWRRGGGKGEKMGIIGNIKLCGILIIKIILE
jgi:hypothetical protein